MCNEIQIVNFEKHLVKNGYSNLVIGQYIRKAKEFLKYKDTYSVQWTDYEELKQVISKYLKNTPLSSQKSTIQAALHAYYYFLSGNKIFRRLNLSDFDVDMSIEAEIERFRKYLTEVAKLSDSTIVSQCNAVKIFLYCCFPKKDFSPEKITVDHVRVYLTNTLRHVSNVTRKTIIVRIRSYVRFLEFNDGVKFDKILKLPMTSPVWKQAGISKYLTDLETNALLAAYDQSNPTGIRDYAIARCLKDLGLRCSEVARLSLNDFEWLEGTVTIRQTKTNSERSLPLHVVTGKTIEKYLLHSRPDTQERILFVRFKKELGQPMGTSQVRNTVRRAAIRAGIENFTGTHMLRHTAAKEMINNGVDLKMIADILGHESIETTSIYTKINFTELQDVAGIWPEVRT
ncbi:tyrosine-type recombinase/integrase [Gracilibacillus massiliensis]|uniref:tyrosine-type recombinase/integrase n=1 Tax=Gracilibacillus massiliensis TaxID=1564956 RepID=UPI00071D510C|nr:site-specific integrase [Gracilibacillus massiliensis]